MTIDVAVNLLWCRPGKVGGSEDYLVRQLLGLAEIGADVAPTLFVLPGFAAAHTALAALYPLVEAPFDGANRVRRVLAEQRWLSQRTAAFSLVHHGGGTAPRTKGKVLLTIHDLQHRTYPHYVSRVKRAFLDWVLPRSVRRAQAIAVPTEFVRRTVIEAYGIAPDKVLVVPHGIEPTLGATATPEAELRTRFALGDGPVLVLPAMTHPHKGHAFAIDLMAAQWTDPSLRLVLIGGEGAAETEVRARIVARGQGARVLRLGRVATADRDGLLQMATAMVFPSEYEGFGAPVIEAMALGAPVICSNSTCLPEVAGDAAEVLALDPDAWAGALSRVADRRAELIARGHRRAAEFTTARSAHALVAAYERALR